MKKAYRIFVFIVMIPFMISVYVCIVCWIIGFTLAWPFSKYGGFNAPYWATIRSIHAYITGVMFTNKAV